MSAWNSDKSRRRSGESGSVMIFVLVGLVTVIGFTALGIDLGLAYNARTQAQGAVDAAALAAAGNMISDATVTLDASVAAATSVAAQNKAYPNQSLTLAAQDLTYGQWDLDTRTLDTAIDLTNASQVTAVEAVIRLDDDLNQSVPAVMARVLGVDAFSVQTSATAYLGFAGSVGPGEIELPVAIPCCVLNGPNCSADYCADGEPIPNPCALNQDQARGDNTVTCIQFQNTTDQTGCWTQFDTLFPAINTADLVNIVNTGNQEQIGVDDSIYLDNGDKTPVIKTISDRFLGEGNFAGSPEGTDTDGDGIIDSWITAMTVVDCQQEDKCAKGLQADVEGFVCVEIREVTDTPDKIIRLQFLCPELHPARFQQCLDGLGMTGTGGKDFGIRADIPVLVR